MHSNINHGRLTSEQSCTRTLEHSKTKWYWVNHGRTIMHSNSTRQAKSRQARALKRQASCLLPVDAFGRRAVEVIICMITRDFNVISIDVTGVSLSLSQASLSLSLLLTKVTHAQYRKRFRVSYNSKFHLTLPLREASPRTRAARSLKIETLIREIVWWKI